MKPNNNTLEPWQTPAITTLSISRNTEQLLPPDPGEDS